MRFMTKNREESVKKKFGKYLKMVIEATGFKTMAIIGIFYRG